jgi:hypothetical protein
MDRALITQAIRAELTRLEAGLYDDSLSSDERCRMIGRYCTLLKECGAPVDVRINEAGQWQTRLTSGPGFERWWSEQLPGSEPFGLRLQRANKPPGSVTQSDFLGGNLGDSQAEYAAFHEVPRRLRS